MFADASRSGDDVFVVTRQQLVPSDRDDYVDLYDVRVGPATAVQPVDAAPACEGEACQGALSPPPPDEVLSSLSLESDATRGARHARLSVRHRLTLHGAVGLLSVKLGAAGRIRWRGRGLAAGSLTRRSAGTVKLRLRLGKKARARVKRSGSYRTMVHLSFRAGDGSKATRSVRVTFRATTATHAASCVECGIVEKKGRRS
jgi:hypothetical protein